MKSSEQIPEWRRDDLWPAVYALHDDLLRRARAIAPTDIREARRLRGRAGRITEVIRCVDRLAADMATS